MSEILYDRQQRALGQEINNRLQQLTIGIICEQNLFIQEIVKQLSLVGVKKIYLFMKKDFEPVKVTSITQYEKEEGLENIGKVDVLITSSVQYANQLFEQTKVIYASTENIIHVKQQMTIKPQTQNVEFYSHFIAANLFMYWFCNFISGTVQDIKLNVSDTIKTQRI